MFSFCPYIVIISRQFIEVYQFYCLILRFTRCARSISIPSNPIFCENISWTFSSQLFHVYPFVSFIPSIFTLFQRDLSSNYISLSWTYLGSIWYSYISWISLSSFSILFSTLSTFSSNLFCVNSRVFFRSLILFFNLCITCLVSLKLSLIKLVIFSACLRLIIPPEISLQFSLAFQFI